MDGRWFHQALERVNATQADLARQLRLAPSAVSRMMKGERQMKLLEAVQIADFLGASQEEVLRHAGEATAPPPPGTMPRGRGRPPSSASGTSSSSPAALARGSDQIPIRSAARGGGDQEMFLEDGPIGYTPRPANLGGVRSAYAIYMVGDSMEPRYEPGWLLHVNPFKPPTRGRDVVVYKADNSVLIKQFVGWESDTLVLHQLNPTDTLRVPRAEVRECHLVVGADQEG
jgi:phage repressor protein C with HTH and peptisase S24 domain